MQVTIEYFAQFRELAGVSSEAVEIASPDIAAIYQSLVERYGFDLPQQDVKPAVNDEFVDWGYQLNQGDRVVFIPPVAGG